MSTPFSISADFIADQNARLEDATTEDFDALKRALARHGIDADALVQKVMAFGVAIPTWASAQVARGSPAFQGRVSRAMSSRKSTIVP